MVAATSVMRLVPFFKARGVTTVLDYGAGTLRNSKYLLKKGFRVWVVDTEEKLKKYARSSGLPLDGLVEAGRVAGYSLNMDLALANFVLNTMAVPEEKKAVINNINRNLRKGGYYLAEVAKKGNGFSEVGWRCELDELILPAGFQRLKVLNLPTSWAVLYVKG